MKLKHIIPIGLTAAVAACIAAAASKKNKSDSGTAYIYQNGDEIEKIPLDGSTDGKVITVKGENGEENVIEVTGDKVHMRSSTCKDQLCVKKSCTNHEDTPIVCLPNKVVIIIKK